MRTKLFVGKGKILGLALLITSVIIILSYLVLLLIDSRITATDVQITNVTDTAFTVIWRSESANVGSVVVSENGDWNPLFPLVAKEVYFDDRDVEIDAQGAYTLNEGGVRERYTHHVTVRGLNPESNYSIRIPGLVVGREIVEQVETDAVQEQLQTPLPGYGLIEGVNGSDTILVFSATEDSDRLYSTYTSRENTYTVDMNFFPDEYRQADLLEVQVIHEQENIYSHSFTDEDFAPFDTLQVAYAVEEEEQTLLYEEIPRSVAAQSECEPNPDDIRCTNEQAFRDSCAETFPEDTYCADANWDTWRRYDKRSDFGGARCREEDVQNCRPAGGPATPPPIDQERLLASTGSILVQESSLPLGPGGEVCPVSDFLDPDVYISQILGGPTHSLDNIICQMATDINMSAEQDVLAAVDGQVSFSGLDPSCGDAGFLVRIQGDNGYTYHYSHLDDENLIPRGARVRAGQVIGKVYDDRINGEDRSGDPGQCYSAAINPHIHFFVTSPDAAGPGENFVGNTANSTAIVQRACADLSTQLRPEQFYTGQNTQVLGTRTDSLTTTFPNEGDILGINIDRGREVFLGYENRTAITRNDNPCQIPQEEVQLASEVITDFDEDVQCWGTTNTRINNIGETCSEIGTCVNGASCVDGRCIANGYCSFHYTAESEDVDVEPDLCASTEDITTERYSLNTGLTYTCEDGVNLGPVGQPGIISSPSAQNPQLISDDLIPLEREEQDPSALAFMDSIEERPLSRPRDRTWNELRQAETAQLRSATGLNRPYIRYNSVSEVTESTLDGPDDEEPYPGNYFVLHWAGSSGPTCVEPLRGSYFGNRQTKNYMGVTGSNACSNYVVHADGEPFEIVDPAYACVQCSHFNCNTALAISVENCGAGDLGRGMTYEQVETNINLIIGNIEQGYLRRAEDVCVVGHFETDIYGRKSDPGPQFMRAVCQGLHERGYPVRCNHYEGAQQCDPQPSPADVTQEQRRLNEQDSNQNFQQAMLQEFTANAQAQEQFQGPGVYSIRLDSFQPIYGVYIEDQERLRFFLDDNNNGIKDEGEEFVEVDESQLEINRTSISRNYNLSAGWNLIALPLLTEDVSRASDIFDFIESRGGSIMQIANYQGNTWEMYGERGRAPFGSDFNILPGKGYFVKMQENFQFLIDGDEISDPVPIFIDNGWNLVGVVSPQRQFNSEVFIQSLNEDSISADTVSQFENGIYTSVVLDDEVLFGNNFRMIDKRGYFVRVDSGGGTQFTPD